MKTNLFKLFIAVLAISVSSCSKNEIEAVMPESSLYLDQRTTSFDRNFANYADSIAEIVIDVRVNVTGEVKDYDRVFTIASLDSSTAQLGVDYEFVQQQFVIPQGELTSLVQVRLLKNDGLKNDTKFLYLKVQSGSDFTKSIKGFDNVVTVSMSNIISAPLYWARYGNNYLGPFSEKKFLLLQDIAGMPADALSEINENTNMTMLIGMLKRWGTILKRHIDQQRNLGTPVLEENGQLMRYGSYM